MPSSFDEIILEWLVLGFLEISYEYLLLSILL